MLSQLLLLPASLLALFARLSLEQSTQDLPWPYNLPADVKYYPEHEVFLKRDEEIQRKMQKQQVVGVKKMSDNEGEKFYLEYWSFAPEEMDGVGESSCRNDIHEKNANVSFLAMAQPPLLPHSLDRNAHRAVHRSWRSFLNTPRLLGKRDFQCPRDTYNCESIKRPDSCCPSDQTCQLIEDTGLGDVGCCPAGQTCGGSLADCGEDLSSCPGYPNKGCCISGYACVTGGCVQSSTATVLVSPSTRSTRTTTSTSTSQRPSPTPTTTSLSSTRKPLTCSPSYRSCPGSLGGGCCPSTRACGRDYCPELSSTGTVDPPVRRTSNEAQTTSNPSITGCPTGFYACAAFYEGGCCRRGRDCAPTSCPTGELTTLVDGSVVTVAAPSSSGLTANTALTGGCQTGWVSCAATQGGGCCPNEYACGSSCTATASVSGSLPPPVAKLPPNSASVIDRRKSQSYYIYAAFLAGIMSIGG